MPIASALSVILLKTDRKRLRIQANVVNLTNRLDTYTLARSHSSEAAAINVAATMIGGLAAVWIGYAAGVRV